MNLKIKSLFLALGGNFLVVSLSFGAELSDNALNTLDLIYDRRHAVLEGKISGGNQSLSQNVIVVSSNEPQNLETDLPVYNLQGKRSNKSLALVYGAKAALVVGTTVWLELEEER